MNPEKTGNIQFWPKYEEMNPFISLTGKYTSTIFMEGNTRKNFNVHTPWYKLIPFLEMYPKEIIDRYACLQIFFTVLLEIVKKKKKSRND